ncbi:MAG: GGDEF domain-containing protein [Deltaproteobacteria bacterium]|nr:GGDEF domain-containing protein [Deltaproteobacteria bacterium]
MGTSDKHAPLKTVPLEDKTSIGARLAESLKATRRPVLVIMFGKQMGQSQKLEGTVTVGRDPGAEVALTDPSVSWHHARIEPRGDEWVVVDLGSTNGTFVNATKVTERVLVPTDRIAFGSVVARYELQDALTQAYDDGVARMLNIDELSGLYVGRRFDAEMEAMLLAARASGGKAGLLVMDLDGIKAINDTHGHLFGAYVIGEAGHVIGKLVEGRGVATRFGGDEFCAALPGLGVAETAAVGGEILAAIGSNRFEKDGVLLHPGISIGAAAFPESAKDSASLFQRADEALYRAKRGGKNRVCL